MCVSVYILIEDVISLHEPIQFICNIVFHKITEVLEQEYFRGKEDNAVFGSTPPIVLEQEYFRGKEDMKMRQPYKRNIIRAALLPA